MRVLHVYAGPFPSHQGTQVYLRGLLGAQAALGHRVALRCWHGGAGEVPEGVEVRRLRPEVGGDRGVSGPHWSRVGLAAALSRALKTDLSEPWDVVHAHHVEAPLLARAVGARPLVHHLHTCLSEELPTYGLTGGRTMGAALDRACVRVADGTVALSERGAGLARRWGARRVVCLPPGVEPLTGDPERGRTRFDLGQTPWVAYVGNLDGYQDLDRWLADAARLDLPLLFITGEPAGRVRSRAEHMGIRRLAVASTRDFQAQCDALSAAAIAVIPRRRCAGVPMKLMVSLGLGVPTLVAAGAVDPRDGVVAVPAAALAQQARDLLRDLPRRQALGIAARQGIARSTWAEHASEMNAFYAVMRGGVTAGPPRT